MIPRGFLLSGLVLFLACGNGNLDLSKGPWEKAEMIVQQISLPDIPEGSFLLSDFGGNDPGYGECANQWGIYQYSIIIK